MYACAEHTLLSIKVSLNSIEGRSEDLQTTFGDTFIDKRRFRIRVMISIQRFIVPLFNSYSLGLADSVLLIDLDI